MKSIHDQEFDDYMVDCVVIDEANVTDEFCRVAADRAYWGSELSQAIENELMAKLTVDGAKGDLKNSEAKAYLAVKLEYEGAKKPPGVDHTNALVEVDENVSEAQRTLMAARGALVMASTEKERIHGIVTAIDMKRDMLISLGAHLRKEMVGEPSI